MTRVRWTGRTAAVDLFGTRGDKLLLESKSKSDYREEVKTTHMRKRGMQNYEVQAMKTKKKGGEGV